MIGTCRHCRRTVAFDEARCPYCGVDRPVELPWAVGPRGPQHRPPPTAARRWGALAAAAVALALAVSLCSGAAPADGAAAAPAPAAAP